MSDDATDDVTADVAPEAAMATALHCQAVALLYGVRVLRAQTPAERETPRGKAVAELVERGAELLVVLLDPNADAAAYDAEPARCEAHGCEHPEEKRREIRGMGGAKPQFLCVACNCTVDIVEEA